jgi:erythromycin esterase-like protein
MASPESHQSGGRPLLDATRRSARPIPKGADADDQLFEKARAAQLVLLGEASHGTHEFYRQRAEITKRLIREADFAAVAVEADWPDAYRVNRYVRGLGSDTEANQALADFERFPTWMWRNADVLDFVGWLRAENERRDSDRRAGFYGLDLYSLHSSIAAVLSYLERVDPEAAERARRRYACFDHFGEDPQAYGYATELGLSADCEAEVLRQLVDLHCRAGDYSKEGGRLARDEYFFAEQNARLVARAENYYRSMFRGRVESWNLRDAHMAETLEVLREHLAGSNGPAKIIVWAHNSHVGDATATEMGAGGEWNIGQLVRERHGKAALLVGFTTHSGTVTAASEWNAPLERKRVLPALPGSYEALFHETGIDRFLIFPAGEEALARGLSEPRLERAIGVIYLPETERQSHYFRASLPRQFDAVIHIDQTRAVEPLEEPAEFIPEPVPETFPFAV